jgi:porin
MHHPFASSRRWAVVSALLLAQTLTAATPEFSNRSWVRHQSEDRPEPELVQEEIPEATDEPSLWDRDLLTGNWWGYREKLAADGVTINISYVADALGNVAGGESRGFRYTSSTGVDLNLDLEKLADLQGWRFHTTGVWRYGRNLSQQVIGNVFTAAQVFGGQNARLYNFYLQKTTDDERWIFKFGRLGQGDDFLSSPLYWNYVNNGFDGNPVAVFFNAPMEAYPNATWGAMMEGKPVDDWYFKLGVYGADTDLNRNSAHGLDWTFRFNKGAFLIGQGGYRPNSTPDAIGLPGSYSVGWYYVTGQFALQRNPAQDVTGTYGGYVMLEQMLFREGGPGTTQGLTAWSALLLAPPDRAEMPFFINGGLVYKGLFPGRAEDTTAFGFIYGRFSSDLRTAQQAAGLPLQTYEAVLEFTHRIVITPWFYIQPDMQVILNPGGTGNLGTALVLGAQVGVNF